MKAIWRDHLKGLFLAFSVWTVLPVPRTDFERAGKYALRFFPLVGAVLGLLFWLWTQVALRLGISSIPLAFLTLAFSLIFTGGIHLDGFMDVADALTSGKDKDGKLAVLKDPHIGAFAVIRTIVLILLQLSFLAELAYYRFLFVAAGFTLSRLFVVITIKRLKPAKPNGMLASLRPEDKNALPELILAVLILSALAFLYLWETVLLAIFSILLYWQYGRLTKRHFGGISGDTCGFVLEIYETAVFFVAALLTWLQR